MYVQCSVVCDNCWPVPLLENITFCSGHYLVWCTIPSVLTDQYLWWWIIPSVLDVTLCGAPMPSPSVWCLVTSSCRCPCSAVASVSTLGPCPKATLRWKGRNYERTVNILNSTLVVSFTSKQTVTKMNSTWHCKLFLYFLSPCGKNTFIYPKAQFKSCNLYLKKDYVGNQSIFCQEKANCVGRDSW